MTAKNRNILAKTLVCALLTAATVTSKAKQTIGVTKTQARLIVVGIAASCAAIGVVVYYIVHHNRGLTGCGFSGENGLQLKSQGDEKSYSLVGEVAEIGPGERIHVSSKKQKKNANLPHQFLVEKLSRKFGPCHAPPASA